MGDKSPNPAELAEDFVVVEKRSTKRDAARKRKRTSSVTPRSNDEEIEASEENVFFENGDVHSSGSTTPRHKAEGKETAAEAPTPDLEPDGIIVKGPSIRSAASSPSKRSRTTILPSPRHLDADVAADAGVAQQSKLPTPDLSDESKRELGLEVDKDPDEAQSNGSMTSRIGARGKGEEKGKLPDAAVDANDAPSNGPTRQHAGAKEKGKENDEVRTAKVSFWAGDAYIHGGHYEAIPADAPPCLYMFQLIVIG
jgi:hypothetical protein